MKKRLFRVLSMAVLVLLIGVSVTGCQKQEKAENDSSAAAEAAPAEIVAAAVLPGDLANLPQIKATPWVNVCDDPACEGLEGPAFDTKGNLYVCHIPHGEKKAGIYKITPDGEVSSFYELEGPPAVTIAIHKDGTIYAGVVTGQILVLDDTGKLLDTIDAVYNETPLHIDDMIFDANANLYLTHFAGDITNPIGGVYRLEANDGYKTVTPVIENMVGPNGLSLGPDGTTLWVSESTRGTILRVGLNEEGFAEGRSPDSGVHPVYTCTGMNGPDSNKTDSNGNLYQVVFGTGRAVILNERGIPTHNLIIEGSEKGEMLFTTNLTIEPGTTNGYFVGGGKTGGWVCKFDALSTGTLLYSHQ